MPLIDVLSYIDPAGEEWVRRHIKYQTPFFTIYGKYLGYDFVHCKATNLKITFPEINIDDFNSNSSNIRLSQAEASNDSDVLQTEHIVFSEDNEETISTQTTNGVTIGSSVTATATADILFASAEVSTSISAEYDYTKTEEITKRTTRHWETVQDINIPPKKRIKVDFLLATSSFSIPVDIECDIDLNVAFKFNKPETGDTLWSVYPIGMDCITGLVNVPYFNGWHFKGSATLKGGIGLKSYINIKQFELNSNKLIKSYTIPCTDTKNKYSITLSDSSTDTKAIEIKQEQFKNALEQFVKQQFQGK